MRITSPIDRPLQDEHVIGVDPPLQPELPGVWRRRINAFTGRGLSDRALTAEQEARGGIQRLRGQSVTAGVIKGLDLLLEAGANTAPAGKAVMQVLPGLALTRAGEDVVVSSARRIALGDLPVYARVDQLDAIASGAPAGGPLPPAPSGDPNAAPPPGGVLAGLRPALPRRVGPPMAQVITKPASADLPTVAILVAQPVVATIQATPTDTCPRDPRDDPFDDLQRIDGARLLLMFWPSEMVAVAGGPDYGLPPYDKARRNRLAHDVFDVERWMLPGETHPWEEVGVPLAVIGFNPDWTLDFVDRAMVVRLGGQPTPRTSVVARAGTPVLWLARVGQFIEHLADLPDFAQTTLLATFRKLPPVGFLPLNVIDLHTRRQTFFPAGFGLGAAPVPTEDLDSVLRDSASLLPISLDVPDDVELLVPVPERVYEPGLLETATVDPDFNRAITRTIADRTDWLVRREMIRRRRDLLVDAATGTRPKWPAGDLPADETLPYPTTRAPVTATRVRRLVVATGARSLRMLQAGSQLSFAAHDRVYVWVRSAVGTNLTGLSMNFAPVLPGGGAFPATGVFWGSAANLPMAASGDISALRAGDLPSPGTWTRLEVSADRAWTTAGAPLAGTTINGMDLSQVGGTVEWGPMGTIDADGLETIWVADDVPPGALLSDTGVAGADWPHAPAGHDTAPTEDDFGTVVTAGVRSAAAVLAFRSRWALPFLTPDFTALDNVGLDTFIATTERRLKATNDAVDAGFVRARADIYRVRQFMLGADAASHLVTSPALADLAVRNEGARASGEALASFLRTAYTTDFSRDPSTPLQTRAPQTGGPVLAAATTVQPTLSLFRENVSFTAVRPAPTTTTAFLLPQAVTGLTAQPLSLNLVAAPAAQVSFAARPTILQLHPSVLQATTSLTPVSSVTATGRGFTSSDVRQQLPLPGAVERTLTVAERLPPAPSVEAQQAALAGKLAVIATVAALLGDTASGVRPTGIALGDIIAPGFALRAGRTIPAPRIAGSLADIIQDGPKAAAARDYDDTDQLATQNARHEADYFRAAVQAIDNTIALMRLIEGRIDLYERMLADARSVRQALWDQVNAVDARLRTIWVELEEARHDFAVATALLAEERARVDALNDKRTAILAANAKMVVFRRPRQAPHVHVVATSPATSALAEPPIVVCMREHDNVPEELHDYAGLFRDAPVSWFPAVRDQLRLLDRLDAARAALLAARQRAMLPWLSTPVISASAPPHLRAVQSSMVAQRNVYEQRRLIAAQLDLSAIAVADLSIVRRAMHDAASMADVIAGEHNRPSLARLAAGEIDGIGQAAGCLHASFADVPPVIRLAWADLLSEFDNPAPLSNLAGLPRWGELPLEDRRTQQGLVDWLFSRIDRSIKDAENAMNELVRVCLLLAAHAPVDRIIPARLVAPVPARIGVGLDLAVDIRVARIGMTALIRGADTQPIAHAIVEDLAEGVARARITRTFQPLASIATTVRVDLSDAAIG
jgi:hypothetical protein